MNDISLTTIYSGKGGGSGVNTDDLKQLLQKVGLVQLRNKFRKSSLHLQLCYIDRFNYYYFATLKNKEHRKGKLERTKVLYVHDSYSSIFRFSSVFDHCKSLYNIV